MCINGVDSVADFFLHTRVHELKMMLMPFLVLITTYLKLCQLVSLQQTAIDSFIFSLLFICGKSDFIITL